MMEFFQNIGELFDKLEILIGALIAIISYLSGEKSGKKKGGLK